MKRRFAQGAYLSDVSLFVLVALVGLAIVLLPLTTAAGLVLGSVAFLLTLIRPSYGLYLLIFAIPWSIKEVQIGPVTVGATEALVALVLAAWLAKMAADEPSPGEIKTVYPPLSMPLLLFLAAALLTLMGTLSLAMSLKEILKWLEVLVIYLFVANNLNRGQARITVALILAAGISQALLGFYQFFGRLGPEGFLIADRFLRAYGTFAQPNPYGGYLGLILPLAYALFVTDWREEGFFFWALAGIGLFSMGLAMLMTLSRGAWLGFAAALVAMNVVRSRRALVFFSLATLLLVIALLLGSLQLLPPLIVERFTDFFPYLSLPDVRKVEVTAENWAVIERVAHWQAAWGMFSHHPWLGVGIGNYPVVYDRYALPNWEDPLGHAHNYYLNIAAEAGLVGLSAYLLLFGACFWQGWRTLRRAKGYWQGVALGILGILVALSVHNFFDNLYVHGMNMHFGLILGLMYVVGK